jgi:class 3 adenylate cyclase
MSKEYQCISCLSRATVRSSEQYIKIIFCALILPLHVFAQRSPYADSLIGSLSQVRSDTSRIIIYCDVADAYSNINTEEGLKWSKKALEEARRVNWGKGIALAMINVGNNYRNLSRYDSANEYYRSAYDVSKKVGYKTGIANSLNCIGMLFHSQSNYPEALRNVYEALSIFEEIGKKEGVAMCYGNIASIYQNLGDWNKSKAYYTKALAEYEKMGDKQSIAINLTSLGSLYQEMGNPSEALQYQQKALAASEANGLDNLTMINLSNIGVAYSNLFKYTEAIEFQNRSLQLAKQFGDDFYIAVNLGNLGMTYLQACKGNAVNALKVLHTTKTEALNKAGKYLSEAITLMEKTDNLDYLSRFYASRSEMKELKGDGLGALNDNRKAAALRDSVFSTEARNKVANLDATRERLLKEKQAELDRIAAAKKRNERLYFIAGLSMLLLVVFFVARERKRSEKLLLNILPSKIAKRLKKKEHPIADYFDAASILFIDMANFTPYTRSHDPKVTVSTLNDIFTRFDMLAEQYGLEKIKTIGDCYMAVAGVPQTQADHAHRAAEMAIAVKESIKDYIMPDGEPVAFRIGIDCGPVVAGVIGRKKFSYDLWGHAVNSASRMETMGIPGEIHCTDNFRKAAGNGYHFVSRGMMNIKGLGEMETWIMS